MHCYQLNIYIIKGNSHFDMKPLTIIAATISISLAIGSEQIKERLFPECSANQPPLQVNYEHVKYYSGEVNCGNVFLEADIGGGIDIPPKVTYPSNYVQPYTYYTLIMFDPDADLADNGSWSFDNPNPAPGKWP